jgi:hypothetical protein
MIRSKTKLQSQVIKAITVDDITLLYTDFQGTAVDASEKPSRTPSRRPRFSADNLTAFRTHRRGPEWPPWETGMNGMRQIAVFSSFACRKASSIPVNRENPRLFALSFHASNLFV